MHRFKHVFQFLPCFRPGGVIRNQPGETAIDIDAPPIQNVKGFG